MVRCGARTPPPRGGGTHGGGAHLISHLLAFLFLRQSTFYIALHCIALTQTKRLRKEIYIIKQNIHIYIYIAYSRPNGWTDGWNFLWKLGLKKWFSFQHFFKKSFYMKYCLLCKYIFGIIIYNTIFIQSYENINIFKKRFHLYFSGVVTFYR